MTGDGQFAGSARIVRVFTLVPSLQRRLSWDRSNKQSASPFSPTKVRPTRAGTKMVRAIITWSLHNRLIVLLGAVMLIGVGLYSAYHLNIEAYPDPTPPLVEVITQNPGREP